MLAFLDKIPYGSPTLKRVAFWLLTAFILYVLIGFFVLPPVTRAILADQLTTQLHRQSTVERVAFNPLTFRVEIHGIKVAKREGEGDFISASAIIASPDIQTIWELAPIVDYVVISDLVVDVTFFGEGRYSITDLMGSKRKEEVETRPENREQVFPFAIHNYEMTNATIIFDDQPHGKKHVISDLNLFVPFTSSIVGQRKEFTQPRLSAVINGDPIELTGRTLPFDESLRTEFQLGAVKVDLNQYWSYMPISSSLQLDKGQFTSNLSLFFERPPGERMRLFVGGGGSLNDLQLSHPADGTVVSLGKLEFDMERFSLGDNELTLNRVTFDQPYVKLIRNEDNSLNWVKYFPDFGKQPEPATEQPADEPAAPFKLNAQNVAIQKGTLEWVDKAVPGGFTRVLEPLDVTTTDFSTAADQPLNYEITVGDMERFSARGQASINPLMARGVVEASGVDIPTYKPYLHVLPLEVGSGTVELTAGFQAFDTPEGRNAMVDNATSVVRDLALFQPGDKEPSIGFKELAVKGVSLDLASRTVVVNEVDLDQPSVRVIRRKDGKIDLAETIAASVRQDEATRQAEPADEPAAETEAPASTGEQETAAQPWTATVNRVRLTEGTARFSDLSFRRRADFALSKLRVNLDNISTRPGSVAAYDVSTRWGGGGTLAASGDVTLDTLASQGKIALRKVGLKPLDPFLIEFSELLLGGGAVSSDLKYDFSGINDINYSVDGDFSLNDFKLMDDKGKGEFSGIDEFKLTGISFANEPFRLAVKEVSLDGPRAVVAFDQNGRMNIKRLFRIPDAPSEADADKGAKEAKTATPAKETAKEASAKEALPEEEKEPFFKAIDIGKVTLRNGRVSYADASLKPPFRTSMTDMTLDLTDIAQTPEARPKLDFSAKLGPAPLTVTGVANPVVKPIYTDLAINLDSAEMVPLSSYTIKYLAYPVEKGRLHTNVSFKTENNELIANNRLFIEQLVLGPKDNRPDAPSIPVKFGLALLQDSNGDMQLNLPIRGQLDDPDFHIGGIIFQTIANLFIKALASPFSLIGSMFGSGEELDYVVFRPGRSDLDAEASKKLDTMVTAMQDRPKLRLEVDGVVDPDKDAKALLEISFNNKLKQVKYDDLSRKEQAETTVAEVSITPEEYEDVLFEVYKEEPDPEGVRPTTLFITERQPVEFMEQFVKERITVTRQDLDELARRRAATVKEYISFAAPLLAVRIYLLDKRTDASAKEGVPDHRADLGIK